jgi:subtilisin-like proprotein convertase family protein
MWRSALSCLLLGCLLGGVACALSGALQPRAAPWFGNESTSRSLDVYFSEFESLASGDTMAYELSRKTMAQNDWTVVDSDIGSEGYNISTVQIVSVRVDDGVTITSGTFELALTRGGYTPDDPEHEFPKRANGARTIAIDYDATAAQMKTALGYLTNVVVREVKRCDENVDSGDVSIGLGGFEGWLFGCPYGSQGGYRWLVVFDVPLNDVEVPALYTYRNDLQSDSWSGSGPQVTAHRITRAMINPNLCLHRKCMYRVDGLEPGTPYAFRTRALTSGAGWTDYSKVSSYRMTLEERVPTRMKPPTFSSASFEEAFLRVKLPSKTQNVQRIESQYREVGSHNWLDGETLVLADYVSSGEYVSTIGKSMILRVAYLGADKTYEARIRAVNHIGTSVWSSACQPFTTALDEVGLSKPPAPVLAGTADSLGSDFVSVTVMSNPVRDLPAESVAYRLQYKSDLQSRWRTYPEPVKFHARKEAVEIQQVLSRRTGSIGDNSTCSGYFYLRLGATSSDDVANTVSGPLRFDATVDEFEAAVAKIGKVAEANPRITARRYENEQNGFTWVVEIQGMGDIPLLALLKHTLLAVDSTGTVGGDCYVEAPSDPVVASTLQNGNDVFSSFSKTFRVGGLESQRGYFFRTQVVDSSNHSQPGMASDATYAKTLPSFQQADEKDYISTEGELPQNRRGALEGVSSRPAKDKAVKPSETVAGQGETPAKEEDPFYTAGAGVGGDSGQMGGNGFCSAITYNARKSQPTENLAFYYTGAEQTYTVPPSSPFTGTVEILTIKCWGGGGGGGKISDLTDATDTSSYSKGGGGAFAQISFHVSPGDQIQILVGGGGKPSAGSKGGAGGYGYGGSGGNGLQGSGGGGGGMSMARRGDEILLIAAGGGGAGSTDYCCAGGGAGGGPDGGLAGSSSESTTPWPITDLARPTAIFRRYEYTSHECPDDIAAGFFCISEWDFLPGSLPAEHTHLQWGAGKTANYTLWAYGGSGGGAEAGGAAGATSSFQSRETGDSSILGFDNRAAVYIQIGGIDPTAQNGYLLRGGKGAGGKEAGGGGGGGYYGGGGGGAGIDGAGGGGGSSFYNSTSAKPVVTDALAASVPAPRVVFVNESSVTIEWELRWDNTRWGAAHSFDVEIAFGPDSEDYFYLGLVYTGVPGLRGNDDIPSDLMLEVASYTATGLSPSIIYRFRVVPVFTSGRGKPSAGVVSTTLALARNYWEPVISRRLAIIAMGRGYANTVLGRPHLTPGVEVFASEVTEDPLRYSEAPTSETPVLPSSRRGSSISLIYDQVYMFGGRTNGYSCALTYKDTLDLGTPHAGREVYPCVSFTAEVSELWKWDIHTYRWQFLNTTHMTGSEPPPERELHTAAIVNGDIYVFGGKQRKFDVDEDGSLNTSKVHKDVVWGDLWRLDVPATIPQSMEWPTTAEASVAPLSIPEDRKLIVTLNGSVEIGKSEVNGDGVDARSGLCIDEIVVSVTVTHSCINQMRLSIIGPGSITGSPNFHAHSSANEVLLYNQRKTNGTGCAGGTHRFTFDRDSTTYTDECCLDGYDGTYKPEGPLDEFLGASNLNEWTLVVQDMKQDGLTGTLADWSLDFTMSQCVPTFSWHNLTAPSNTIDNMPPSRHSHKQLVYDTSFFIFGGRDTDDMLLEDLWRYDTLTDTWTELDPVNFDVALDTSSGVGSSFMMTAWGLLRFGGYLRQPYMPAKYDNYINDVYLQDPSTLRWRKVDTIEWPQSDGTGTTMPKTRYLSASTFIPSKVTHFGKEFSYRNLYDTYPRSDRANYASSLADSILIFGGHDGATGSIQDGTTGGLLGDMWLLRLSNFSTDGVRYKQQRYLEQQCAWRNTAGAESLGIRDCLSTTANMDCDFRDMMMLAWCAGTNQTVGG